MANALNWFEIPATDIQRAKTFYSKVLDGEMDIQEMMGMKMAFLPHGEGEVGGSICEGEGFVPSQHGAKIYLNGGEDLSSFLSRVEPAGGKITMPKTKISDEIGYMAFFLDTEGNNLAFHSPK